jgi:proline iminopeptidase
VTSQPFTAPGPITGWADDDHDAPPLLLLHGGPGMSEYLSMLDAETRGWRTIRYQQRGVAPSTADGPFTIEQNVADAIAVLDELEIPEATVLGHSWGGHLVLQLALAHPDRVTGVVAVDGLGVTGGTGGGPELGQHLAERVAPARMPELVALSERLNGPAPAEEDAAALFRLLWPGYFADPADIIPFPEGLRMDAAVNAATLGSAFDSIGAGLADKLTQLTTPTVFVLGEKSPMPVSYGEAAAALIPGAEVIIVPGAGHLPWHEQPGCVADALRRVVARGLSLRWSAGRRGGGSAGRRISGFRRGLLARSARSPPRPLPRPVRHREIRLSRLRRPACGGR